MNGGMKNNKIMESTDSVIKKAKIAATKDMILPSEVSNNFVHTEPNSHFYTELEHIKNSLKLGVERDHILIGLENTIKMGYKITQELDCE